MSPPLTKSPSGFARSIANQSPSYEGSGSPDFLPKAIALPGLSEAQGKEISALFREKNPEIFWKDFYAFGLRLESERQLEAATLVFAAIAEASVSESVRGKAVSQLHGIQGVGAFAPRFEHLLQRWARESADPAAILPMIVGTTVFQTVRAATLARWTGGEWLRRWAAASAGYFAEVPSFVGSARALRSMAKEGSNQEPGWGSELAGSALTLGVLKFTSAVSRGILGQGHAILEGTRGREAFRLAISQGSMLGGLFAARAVEEEVGLRPPLDGATALTDALASMLSLGAGAHLGQRILGERFSGFHRELDLRASKSFERNIKNFALSGAFGVVSVGGGGFPLFLPGGSRRRSSPVEPLVRLRADLASLRDEINPLAGRIAGLDRRMEARFEYGDSIRRRIRRGKVVYHWKSGSVPSEETGRSEYETYLAWRKAAGLREGPLLTKGSPKILEFGEFLKSRNVELKLESRLSEAQLFYVREILELLPESFFKNHYVRRLSLGVADAGERGVGDEFYFGDARISRATLRGSRRLLAATILHELGHSVEMRYAADLSEISSFGMVGSALGAPILPDLSIPREVRVAMHRHYEVIRERTASAFAMNVFDDSGREFWEQVGFPRRSAYITGSFREFMAEYVLYYIAAGAELRRFIRGPAQTDAIRRAYQGIYEELRARVFDGREYDEHGMIPLTF